ncbi:MAG TPA: hypothetical protein VK957_11720 [Lunatimonas sp.]|nr:hypothetical protein [Lunatimonas sp.]
MTLVLIPTLVATSVMTAFSYGYSAIVKKQFREPELLNILLMRWTNAFRHLTKGSLLGWAIHYLVGFFFMLGFCLIWEVVEIEATLLSGVIMGFTAGILGVIGWQLTFWIHPNPPKLDFKQYYIHLILAHLVFGIGGVITYNYLN